MKKALCALALFCLASVAMAAGPWDGIYQIESSSDYVGVHQNGNNVIAAVYGDVPAFGIATTLNNGQRFFPNNVAVWQLISGSVNGTSGQFSGETSFKACFTVYSVALQGDGNIVATVLSSRQTAVGASQNINCNTLVSAPVFRLFRRF